MKEKFTFGVLILAAFALVMIVAFSTLSCRTARAQALPYVKGSGQCSGSYVQSGSYCVPKSGGTVRPAVAKPKGGSCPSGWAQSGSACERIGR